MIDVVVEMDENETRKPRKTENEKVGMRRASCNSFCKVIASGPWGSGGSGVSGVHITAYICIFAWHLYVEHRHHGDWLNI